MAKKFGYLPSKACLNLINDITLAGNIQALGLLKHAYCPFKAMLLSTKLMKHESQLSEKDHKSLFINEIQKLFILSVFSTRHKVVYKYTQHEEARCQEKSHACPHAVQLSFSQKTAPCHRPSKWLHDASKLHY